MPQKVMAAACAAGVALSLLAMPVARAQEALKWAHVYETTEPYHTWALWAAEQIADRTAGRYAIDVFPASSLGKEVDINEGLTLGTVDIIYTGNTFAARTYGPIGLASGAFVFRDFDHWQTYAASDLFKELAEGYKAASGHQVVSITYYGERHVTSNTPINAPEDMAGLKIRVPNAPLYLMFPRAVGANPTPIAFAEVYLALQQGVVDAQENPLPTILAKKFYEVQNTINLTGHITESLLTIVGGPLWDRLSAEDQAIFATVLTEAATNTTGDIRAAELRLAEEFESEHGTTVNVVDRGPFIEAVRPAHFGPDATWTEEQYNRLQALE